MTSWEIQKFFRKKATDEVLPNGPDGACDPVAEFREGAPDFRIFEIFR